MPVKAIAAPLPERVIAFPVAVDVNAPVETLIEKADPPTVRFEPVTSNPFIASTLSERVINPLPLSITIFPVELPPRVSVWALVVCIVPVALRDRALLEVPEILAVGVPPATLIKANLAEVVDTPPRRTSTVLLYGAMVPLLTDCQ